ncbi:hypothetical protein VCSRO169_3514 [Vibrio cholerae]|nr:hypothetical protein VCSRO169_3514 [Vibrio cholerae]
MGFTDDDIFISPLLMEQHGVNDGMLVKGTAVLNYNKKKMSWGWKALKINNVATE